MAMIVRPVSAFDGAMAVAARPTLVLVRHGESEGNRDNAFTGHRDVDLTERGAVEAEAVGTALARDGFRFAHAFSSALRRSRRSARLILAAMGSDLEAEAISALNERDYGVLTGWNRDDARARWGAEQVQIWRRSYETGPPGGESLRDTAARVLAFYVRTILPAAMRDGPVLLVAHGNSIRALAMALDGLTPEEVPRLEIATGETLIYRLAPDTSIAEKQVRRLAELEADDPRVAP